MNINTLRKEIEADEGVKYELYYCSENHLTGGIGHLITEWDIDYYGKPIGYPVPEQQVQDWFLNDVQVAIQDCQTIFSAFDKLPDEIQHVLINMAFQLGGPRLRKFKMMIAALQQNNFVEAGRQMLDSRWAKQTPNRAQALSKQMEEV